MADEALVTIQSRAEATFAIVRCAELDYESSAKLSSAVVAAGSQAASLPLVLDMSSVEFVPSVALGVLITLTRLFKEAQQRFILVGVQKALRETLSICHLDKLFEMYDTSEDALSHLKNSQ